MGLGNRAMAMLFLVLFGSFVHVSIGAVYKVGDSAGWTTLGKVDYKAWAATKSFQLGDIIAFEYSPQFHNVMQVTHPQYQSCNASSPIATHTTGNDSITITKRGHHFFLCGVPGHCQSGQKVDIHVPRIPLAPTPSVTPSTPTPAGTTPASAPAPSHAAPLYSSIMLSGSFGTAIAVLVALISLV